jgi:hypothetical protein
MRESDPRLQVQAPCIGAAMELGFVHPVEQTAIRFPPRLCVEDSGDAARTGWLTPKRVAARRAPCAGIVRRSA